MLKLYENFHIFHFQKRIVSAETIWGNAVRIFFFFFYKNNFTSNMDKLMSICHISCDYLLEWWFYYILEIIHFLPHCAKQRVLPPTNCFASVKNTFNESGEGGFYPCWAVPRASLIFISSCWSMKYLSMYLLLVMWLFSGIFVNKPFNFN